MLTDVTGPTEKKNQSQIRPVIFYTPIWLIQGTNSGSGGKHTGKRKKDHKQTPNKKVIF